MQQTRFDQWLRQTYAYETHIYTYQIPEATEYTPTELDTKTGQAHRYLWRFTSEAEADTFVQNLRQHNLLFASKVVVRNSPLAKFIAKDDRSVTFLLLWVTLISTFTATVGVKLYQFIRTETFQTGFQNFIQEIQRLTQ